MLLLTMNEWSGPGNAWPANTPRPEDSQRTASFATRLPLVEALERLRNHQVAYNAHYRLAVNFMLLSVSTVEDLTDEMLDFFQVEIVEQLPMTAAEFNA